MQYYVVYRYRLFLLSFLSFHMDFAETKQKLVDKHLPLQYFEALVF